MVSSPYSIICISLITIIMCLFSGEAEVLYVFKKYNKYIRYVQEGELKVILQPSNTSCLKQKENGVEGIKRAKTNV